MIGSEREELEKTVLYQAETAKRDYEANRVKLALMGEKLVVLGQALQQEPEFVTPVPEVDGPDYRDGLNLLNCRKEVIDLCEKLRSLKRNRTVAEQRKAALGF